jgi:D-arginine dehydrogenase
MHASGKNAAILRRVLPDPVTAALARAGGASLEAPPSDLDAAVPLLRAHGVLLTATGVDAVGSLLRSAALARDEGLDARDLGPTDAALRAPVLADALPAAAVYHAADGVVDVAALLDGMLRSARARGAIVATLCPLEEVSLAAGRVVGVVTARGSIATPLVVNAAGSFADSVAARAGLAPLRLVPHRRHLFHAGPSARVPHGSPAVWDVDRGLYVRPEGMGALLSPCDEDVHPPGEPRVSPRMRAILGDKMDSVFPGFGRLSIRRAWAGLRTLSPDGRFVLGPDPRLQGFAWAAALGGHGVSTAIAVGETVAALCLDGPEAVDNAEAMSPGRLL